MQVYGQSRLSCALVLATIAALATAAPASAATYDLDVAHSNVGFSVRHLGVSNVRGAFKEFTGSFDFDPANPEVWKVEATIQAGSIDTRNDKRDEHLRSPDFFDAANHPTLTFHSTGLKAVEGERYQLMGDLTMRGVTKPIVLDLELLGTVKDPGGNQRAGFSATCKINRQDFGLAWSKAIETGGLVVANEVTITIEAEGVMKK